MLMFQEYAKFYDQYYKNKNYNEEVKYLLQLASVQSLPVPKSILDMGCGTGGHLIPLAKMGYDVTGFDISEKMIAIAKQKDKSENLKNICLTVSDAADYRDGRKYDLVIAMFAVMGFITSNEKLLAALKTARCHLDQNGLFIFDCWFGPAVMHTLPSVRVNEFTMNDTDVIRIVEPVDVDLFREVIRTKNTIIQKKNDVVLQHIVEYHEIRFFFIQQLVVFFEQTGFEMIDVSPFMEDSRKPTINDWNITVVTKAI